MKLHITVSNPTGPSHQLRGFDSLELAVAAALGMAAIQPEGVNVGIWLPARKGRVCESAELLDVVTKGYNDTQTKLVARCQRNLETALVKREQSDARRAFIHEVGYDAIEQVRADDAARTALFANDFATVRVFLALLGQGCPSHPQAGMPALQEVAA